MENDPRSARVNVIAVVAMSLDGKITYHDEPGNGFTSAADKKHFVECPENIRCFPTPCLINDNLIEAMRHKQLSLVLIRGDFRLVDLTNVSNYE